MNASVILLLLSFHASSLQHAVTIIGFTSMSACEMAEKQLSSKDFGPFEVRTACVEVRSGDDA